ncbi:ABC transporter substrate-binding protein [Aestuariivirga litoralis]|uniref:ABC transporter substrate-binding protein n=1 Tax=Aestuariivirga litoralis TaxID=2650924 RepID=UPI0018C61555|nr:ABC transporter substrate-binding protein [Aestuariivirga litoralis]MBG1231974.1 hypothetical protein [Aestuariivirga litoralis]
MRLSRRRLLIATVALPFMGVATLPALADGGADDYVHGLGTQVLKMVKGGKRGDKGLQSRFGNLLNQYVNLGQLGSMALGRNRASMPSGDKGMFSSLLSNYAAALFVWYVDDFQGSDLKVTKMGQQGAFTTVDTVIVGSNEPLSWRVTGGPGSWRVADVKVKGVWLSIAMKKMFDDTLNASHGDFQPLYAKLREADTW